jgi:hypothetical protein
VRVLARGLGRIVYVDAETVRRGALSYDPATDSFETRS